MPFAPGAEARKTTATTPLTVPERQPSIEVTGHRVLGDDAELTAAVLAAQDGDETAFRTVYRAVHPRLLGYVRTLVGDADAEDVTSEAWLQIARDLDGSTETPTGSAAGPRA